MEQSKKEKKCYQLLILSVDVVSSDIFDEDREKRDYARSISKKTQRDLN
jgi:hypothetical protein